MAFTATPTDGSGVPIPMSSAVPDGTNTPLAIEGGPSIATGGNTLVPVSMYVKDGNDVAQGTSTDAANASSVIGQLKQIKTNTTLGQAVMASSLPVTLASNQSAVPMVQTCIVSTVNSSAATLTANSIFTGTSESSLNFSAISVEVFANVASAASGLSVQQSQDGANWDTIDTFSIVASTTLNTTVNLVAQFFRVVYTNGATNQATFRLQIIKQPVDVVLPRTLTALGNLKTSLQEVNGTALTLGQTTMAASFPVTLASNQPTQNVTLQATTTGGSTPSHTMSAATTNANTLKASPGLLYGFCISNVNAAARFVKLYNKAANPTVGTDTPVTTIQVPANGTVIRAYPVGMTFSTGIAWAATGLITNADTTAIAANDLSVDFDYL